jgi:hypothetical protein
MASFVMELFGQDAAGRAGGTAKTLMTELSSPLLSHRSLQGTHETCSLYSPI